VLGYISPGWDITVVSEPSFLPSYRVNQVACWRFSAACQRFLVACQVLRLHVSDQHLLVSLNGCMFVG